MVERAVFLEKSWTNAAGAVGVFHYAVKVGDDDWYEIVPSGSPGNRNLINGDLDGHPRSYRERKARFRPSLTLAGATRKTTWEIINFNQKWLRQMPKYDLLAGNCQTYAFELIQDLVGATSKIGLPLSAGNAWAGGPGHHRVAKDGYEQARATLGKAGIQAGIVAAEVEGPMAGAEESDGYVGIEASLVRAEAQFGPAAVRFEPNVNSAIGVQDGQAKVKIVGFGVTIGKGFGIHTPLGSFGFGRL